MVMIKGACIGCKQKYSTRTGAAHLAKCPDVQRQLTRNKEQSGAWLVKVVGKTSLATYWMFILVPERSTLDELDAVLRKEWMECCGHLSAFTIGNKSYSSHPDKEFDDEEEGFDVEVNNIFEPDMKVHYIYDFGSSSELEIQVLSLIETMSLRTVTVLMKNDTPELPCDNKCEKVAALLCSFCNTTFCTEQCTKTHKCVEEEEGDTYMIMKLSNSPRSGICGY